MALTTIAVAFNSNDFMPTPSPNNMILVIYEITITTAGANAYPAGGEPFSFATEFSEVSGVLASPSANPAGVGVADAIGAMVTKLELNAGQQTAQTRFYRSRGAAGNLAELAVGAYPNNMQFQILAWGRPITGI